MSEMVEMRERKRYNLTPTVFKELRDWLNDYYTKRAVMRKERGVRESPGEQRGSGPALARALTWLATLNDDDIERIQEEGARLEAILAARPPDYAEVPGRADPLDLPRRTESVFLPRGSVGGWTPGHSTGREPRSQPDLREPTQRKRRGRHGEQAAPQPHG